MRLPRLLFYFGLTLFFLVVRVHAAGESSDDYLSTSLGIPAELEVIEPFAEMHTGPGRGYPVFYVIEQGEKISILARRPDWYEVRAKGGRIGWVAESQLASTLLPTGVPVDLPSVSYGDYLKNSWRLGFSLGPLASGVLDGANTYTANFGYRPWSWIAADLEFGSHYSSSVSGEIYNANLLFEPFSRWRLSPVLILGGGALTAEAQPGFPELEGDQYTFSLLGAGVHYYLGRSFVIRGEFRQHLITIDESDEDFGAWKIGFNTFF